jgi:hypothetical protein
MRFTRPQWFPLIDEVTIAFALIVAALLLVATMEVWGH